jgi:hypothetical protein
MSAAILGKCPGCKRTLRLPEAAAGKTVRCRHCGLIAQANPTPKSQARQAVTARAVTEQVPVVQPVTAAPVNVTAAVLPPQSADAWSAIADEAFSDATPGRYRRRKGGWVFAVLSLLFLAACLGGTAAAVYFFVVPKIKEANERIETNNNNTNPETPKPNVTGNPDQPVVAGGNTAFPRRLLGISVNNFIYANPTSYGYDASGLVKRDFGKTLEKIANRFRIPEGQVVELSDGAPKKPNPPVKPIFEQTLTRFLESSRAQDRVIVVLCVHTIEIEGKPFVVPLEGDMDDAKTMIPLAWVMEQLDRCPAQQKVLIADFNRYDKGRGKERPHGGKLAASTEAMLKNPPAGVQVWSACSAGQYSYEFDDYYAFQGQGVKGGAFLCMFSVAFLEGLGGKIQKPDDPLPIDALAKKVNLLTEKLSQELDEAEGDAAAPAEEKKDPKKSDKKDDKEVKKEEATPKPAKQKAAQTPFLAGSMKGEPVAYNPAEPLPKPVAIPTPQEVYAKGVVPPTELKKMMDIFSLPPVREAQHGVSSVRFDQVLPFSADVMKDYMNNTSVEQIRANPEKYPLRKAVVDAIETLRKLDGAESTLPTSLRENEVNDANKARLSRLQKPTAAVMLQLKNILEALQKAGEERKDEKSKFWQATFDYIVARVQARYVFVNEFNSMIGQVRKDNLPDLDKKKEQVGWKLASQEALKTTDGDVKEMQKELRKLYKKLAKDHPGTPWAVLAKREYSTALGLRWEPFGEAKTAEPDAAAEKERK